MRETLLGCCILVLLLAGCGGGKTPASPAVETQPNPTATLTPVVDEAGAAYPAPDEPGADKAYPVAQPTLQKKLIITDTPDVVRSPVIISDVIKQGDEERIVLKNVTQQDQEITLWSILLVGTDAHFNIPECRLAPGAIVTVYNGPGEISKEEGFKWLGQPQLVERGDQYSLLNRAGRLIWAYVYYP
jgi:hypothetical protein